MKLIKVAAATLNQTPLDWKNNLSNILGAIKEAKRHNASILCLPELCITGYGCEDAFLSPGLHSMAIKLLNQIVPQTKGILISLGLPISHKNNLFNTACLVGEGKIFGFIPKRYLARSGIHYEPRWFKPWPLHEDVRVNVEGVNYPFGDLYFDCGGIRIAFEICEDAWVSERPGGESILKGVDIILNPSASHFAFQKQQIRERFVLEGSRSFGVTYIYSNLVGNEAGRAIYDGGAMIASGGRLLSRSTRFCFRPFQITCATVDIDLTRMGQASSAGSHHTSKKELSDPVTVNFSFPKALPKTSILKSPDWEDPKFIKEEEFLRAVALGLFDYLRKTKSQAFVVSLSGGADSSAVSCLVTLMIHIAVKDIGIEEVKRRLRHIRKLRPCSTSNEMVTILLNCVYQSTRNSSKKTRNAANLVATSLKANFLEFDVDAIVQSYEKLVSDQLGRKLNWTEDDIALQNIQARVRSPGIWMLANIYKALLLSTSNRSEAAVGYSTMDGDTSGGLSPIAGVDKAFLRHWLKWLENNGPAEYGPIKSLSIVNALKPTAELRPTENCQSDEADLMPYDLLDAIERAAIRDKKSPLEVFLILEDLFLEHSPQPLGDWIKKFFTLWCRNQWKRERYAPSFHLDDENLDPKTWCRFPILSGGFKQEINDLEDYLKIRIENMRKTIT